MVGSEYQANMGMVDGWNYSKHQFKIPYTRSPTFRIFSDFGIIGVSINVWKALQYFEPGMVVDKTASEKKQEEMKPQTHTQFAECLAMALINNSYFREQQPLHPEPDKNKERQVKKHPQGHRRLCLEEECRATTIWTCTHCSKPGPPKMFWCNGKQKCSRKGYKHFCTKCFNSHVYGEGRHSRKSVSRPSTATANRARAPEGN